MEWSNYFSTFAFSNWVCGHVNCWFALTAVSHRMCVLYVLLLLFTVPGAYILLCM